MKNSMAITERGSPGLRRKKKIDAKQAVPVREASTTRSAS